MLVVTVVLTLLGAHWLDLPVEKAAISVMVLTVSPHVQALLLKGELRIAGALLASVWSIATFVLVGLMPSLLLLCAMLFLGQFLAAYLTRTGGKYSYAGMQMGLVLPMVIVAPPEEFGSLTTAVQRLESIVIALTASVVVAGLWPRFPWAAEPVSGPTTPQASTAAIAPSPQPLSPTLGERGWGEGEPVQR
jgi:hypothetical protein